MQTNNIVIYNQKQFFNVIAKNKNYPPSRISRFMTHLLANTAFLINDKYRNNPTPPSQTEKPEDN